MFWCCGISYLMIKDCLCVLLSTAAYGLKVKLPGVTLCSLIRKQPELRGQWIGLRTMLFAVMDPSGLKVPISYEYSDDFTMSFLAYVTPAKASYRKLGLSTHAREMLGWYVYILHNTRTETSVEKHRKKVVQQRSIFNDEIIFKATSVHF